MKPLTRTGRTAAALLVLCASVALLHGCKSPPTSFYTLSADPSLERSSQALQGAVVVGPVTIPELVDRPQLVTRVSGNEVALDEFARWGEPLRSGIAAAIAGDLTRLLGSERVSVSSQTVAGTESWRVRVDLVQFDSMPGEAVAIDARWTVHVAGRTTLLTGRSTVREPVSGAGYDALVAAHSRALATVSRDIAAAIRQAGS
ncbi:membrane integrity-associated transporter subunit PqiC [Paraburkholderia sp. Tr-20389]|uniref:PqiC family protein n=1 Tax=Paraburkholderia sp. Tr-20389 TaxID=2703903 RepID=UPI0019817AF0|nr:PqiC family protein [Paraburkholderia sp. Tr-20389]MBN3755585.1 membrane integrity-associated transporter subunit PqiC [Paraburkholderia sp. Tr-20389]